MNGLISQRLLPVLPLLLCSIVRNIESTTIEQLYIGEECGTYKTRYVGEHDIFELVWKDEKVPFPCKIWFKGGPLREYNDEYQVCVKPSEWIINDCRVKVNYYFGFNYKPAQTFSCSRDGYPTKVCSGSEEYLNIELKDNTTLGGFYPGSRFRLTITASKTFDYSENAAKIGAIVGGVIGTIVLLTVIGIIVCICICNRKRPRSSGGHVFNPGQSGQTNMAMSSSPVTHTGQTLPLGAYPRQTYPMQQYPTQQYPAVQQYAPQNNASTTGLQGDQTNGEIKPNSGAK